MPFRVFVPAIKKPPVGAAYMSALILHNAVPSAGTIRIRFHGYYLSREGTPTSFVDNMAHFVTGVKGGKPLMRSVIRMRSCELQ